MLPYPWAAKGHRRGRAANTAGQLRLIGPAAMRDAIRKAGVDRFSAKMKICLAGMAHRPTAHALGQVEQAGFTGHVCAGFGRNQPARRGRGDRRLLIAGALPHKAAGADGNHTRAIGGGSFRH